MASDISTEPSTKALNERFFRYFQHEVIGQAISIALLLEFLTARIALQEQMAKLANIPTMGGERSDAVDHCLAGIARLSAEVKDASVYVPPYDQRTYAEAIKALSEKLQTTRNSFAPRNKFSFSTRVKKNPSAISLEDAAELAASQRLKVPGYSSASTSAESSRAVTPAHPLSPEPETVEGAAEAEEDIINTQIRRDSADNGIVRKPSFSKANKIFLSNHTGLHIILPTSASRATTSGMLSHFKNCVVDMAAPTSSSGGHPFAVLALKDINNSLIICGHVSGPIHITSAHDSVIVVAAQQFRMHDSSNVDVYLHCSSRAIIEDCEGIRFAPLPGCYETESTAGAKNLWDQVDDFKWLKVEHSPHWSVLEERKRVGEDVWRDVVPGRPGGDVEEILRAVKGDV